MIKSIFSIVILLITINSTSQVSYKEANFSPPLNIPLILAGNFAELRSNHFHTGLDIKTNGTEGYKIFAIDSGYISRINISHWGYGKALYVRHPNGYTSVYAHLSKFPEKIEKYIRERQFKKQSETLTIYPGSSDLVVSKEELIAYSGNSGSSVAPHLHFEIRETPTEKAVNPLLFGFEIKDDIKPVVSDVKIYPLNGFVEGVNVPKTYSTLGSNGVYTLKEKRVIEVKGEFGIGVNTIDKLNGAPNECGIFTIELFVDNTLIYRQTMEKIDFFTTRYINTHKDYSEYHQNNRSFHKSFLSDNNKLKIYDGLVNKGKINFKDDTVHQLKYIIKDTYGNTSTVDFELKSNTNMETSSVVDNEEGDLLNVRNDNVIEKESFKAYLPENAVYQDLKVKYRNEQLDSTISGLHQFGDSKIPLQHYFVMKIKTQNIPKNMENKAVIVSVSEAEGEASKGGKFREGWVETEIREFGDYVVKIDSTAPVITPVNISEGKVLASAKSIHFKISDDLSGIEKYNAFVDDKWVLGNYSTKTGAFIIPFDTYNNIVKGKHHLKVSVVDERGNETVQEYNFIR